MLILKSETTKEAIATLKIKMAKTKQKYLDSSRKWKQENKERCTKQKRDWCRKNRDKTLEYVENYEFDGNKQKVLERDNFQCQECGMTQERHIDLFNFRLIVHHIDGKGRRCKTKNNNIDNLITLCVRCHKEIHQEIKNIEKWGDLLKQNNSKYRFPMIRKLVNNTAKKLGGIQKAKRAVAEDLDISFWTIDTKYYEIKAKQRGLDE